MAAEETRSDHPAREPLFEATGGGALGGGAGVGSGLSGHPTVVVVLVGSTRSRRGVNTRAFGDPSLAGVRWASVQAGCAPSDGRRPFGLRCRS